MFDNPWYIILYALGLSLFHWLGATAANKRAKAVYDADIAEARKVINQVHELWTYVMENSPEARRLAMNFHAMQAAQQKGATTAEDGDRVK